MQSHENTTKNFFRAEADSWEYVGKMGICKALWMTGNQILQRLRVFNLVFSN